MSVTSSLQTRMRFYVPRSARIRARRSYAEFSHWREYQRFLPAQLKLADGREPVEQYWSWRGAEIHLDRYPAP